MDKNFKRIMESKGWSVVTLATRWGVADRHMYKIVKQPSLKDMDAVNGLPVFEAGE